MRREIVEKLYPPFFKKLKIGPLALEADLLDLRPEFRSRLYDSLLSNGWDQSQSIIVASSDDPNLDGQIIQGRHRTIVISEILKDGHKFDTSKILIRREDVSTVDELRAKRANYELTASLTKDPRMSKKWVDANIEPIIKGRVDQGKTKILAHLHDCGFYNDSYATQLIEKELEHLDKKHKKKVAQRTSFNVPDGLKNQNWNTGGPKPETVDDATTYLREIVFKCEHCHKENKQQVNVACGFNGELVKIALAK